MNELHLLLLYQFLSCCLHVFDLEAYEQSVRRTDTTIELPNLGIILAVGPEDLEELAGRQPEASKIGVFLPLLERWAKSIGQESDRSLEVVVIDTRK
jgi:hypothetical protein